MRAYTLPARWWTISFPYDVATIYSPNFNGRRVDLKPHCEDGQGGFLYGSFWLQKYNGSLNRFYYSFEQEFGGSGECEDVIFEGVGYAIRFPAIILNNANQLADENLTRHIVFESARGITLRNNPSAPKPDGFAMVGNHLLQNTELRGANNYFFYNVATNNFLPAPNKTVISPFEAYISLKNNGSGSINFARAINADGAAVDAGNGIGGVVIGSETVGLKPAFDSNKGNVIEIRYYTIHGAEIKQPIPGHIYIVKRVYDTGVVETNRLINFK
jgi:hypothetical protein